MANGGTIVLNDDVTIDNRMLLDKDVVIDLNGHTIYGPAQNDGSADGAFIVRNGANLTIKGEGKVETRGTYASILLWAQYGATITVEGGEFVSHNSGEVAYTGGYGGGTIIIKGGTFKPAEESNGKYSCLNCYDADFKAGTAKFIVTGGTFFNWNPELSSSEPAPANPKNWVSEGYHAVQTTIDGETAYVVVPNEVGALATTGAEAQDALAAGDNVLLSNDMTVQAQSGAYGNAKAAFVVKGGQTLDGGGNTVTASGAFSDTYDAVVTINEGTLKNVTLANGFRGVLVNFSNTGDVILENVKVLADSNCTYALNVNEGNATCNFSATDCAFYGWSSWGVAAKQFTFVNCMFGAAKYNVVKPYWNTVFENCEFEESMYMDLSEFRTNATLIFRNCTVNGQKLTKENHAQLIKGHLEDGLNDWENWDKVSDCVFFE